MQGDTLFSRNRLRTVREVLSGLLALRSQLQRELASKEQEVETLTRKLDNLGKVGELFRLLMDQLVLNHVKSIEGVVTEGLHTIFSDQSLAFEAAIGQRYNKLAVDFYIKQDDQRVEIKGHPLEAFGGGPASIASLILRILVMRRLKKWPLLALDETLAAVSDEYIDQTGLFLRKLAEKTKIDVLLVTHKSAFLDHAVIGYKGFEVIMDDGDRHLKLQRENHAVGK